ncbi:MAG: DnaJ C-terminal domain-containing protein [Pseudomonadota bacterium]
MQYKDYYKIMGLERNATTDDIKRAYRKLARKYHPDVSKEANAEERFKELGEAYEVLKDTQKRASYDQLGSNWQNGQDFRPPPGWQHFGGEAQGNGEGGFGGFGGSASDFFESLFGGGGFGGGGRQRQRREYSTPGEDYQGKVKVSLEDAFIGATREIQLPIQEMSADGRPHIVTRKLKVKIPAGVKSGQQIRLSGQGAPGMGAGKKGDLYLEIDIEKNPLYDVVGNDVYLTLPVAPWEAALGAKISVPTLAGKVDLKIPAGSQGGQKMRLKGRGMPGSTPGDQYVILKIIIPQPTTDKAKGLYEQMAQEMPFNPREKMGA